MSGGNPPQRPGWYEQEGGGERYWDGSGWVAWWEPGGAEEAKPEPPIGPGTFLLYGASVIIPVVGIVAGLVFISKDRVTDAGICFLAAGAGATALYLGLR